MLRSSAIGREATGCEARRAGKGLLSGLCLDHMQKDELHRTLLMVHTLVGHRFAAELERLANAPVLVLIVPLLFEAGLDGLCNEVWVVDCHPQQQQQRLVAGDGSGEADARARIAAQWPLERKRPLADLVIENQGSPQELAAGVHGALTLERSSPPSRP